MPFNLSLIKRANPIADVIGRQIDLRKQQGEYVGLCPFHGEKTPSFTVVPAKGFFHCFGCGAQGDVIDFVRQRHNVDLRRACEMLGGEEGDDTVRVPRSPSKEPSWQPVMPVPDDVPSPPAQHPKLGKPEHVARVLNQAGELLHLIYRFPASAGGRKEIRPLCFDGRDWVWKGPPDPRPLYGFPLTEGLPVLLVEGEPKRDRAADALTGAFDVVSWPNGANGVRHADWEALRDRDVVLWPDADPPGAEAAEGIVRRLHGVTASLRTLTPPRGVASGWDVADAITDGWDRSRLLAFIGTATASAAPDLDGPFVDPNDPGPEPDEPAPRPRTARSETGEIIWGDPVDFLTDDNLGAPTLLPDHLPPALWPFVTDVSLRMGVDPASVAIAAVVCCASAISDKWKIQPKRFDTSWTEQPRLWGVILGDPSTIKTPVISACSRPIDLLDIGARNRHAEEMGVYRAAKAAFEKAKKKGDDVGDEPRQPRLNRYLVEGATVEALQEVLRDDVEAKQRAPLGKVLCRQDEMSEFFANMDRYNAGGKGGGDRGAYLRLYNGGRFSLDRVMRGSFAVPNWSACFLGGCQPGPIQAIAKQATEDGLLQRFMFCVPDHQRSGQDRPPDRAAMTRYEDLFPALAGLQPSPETGSLHVRALTLHADGHAYREEIDQLAAAMMALPSTSKRLISSFGKWRGLFGRLVLTFHMIEVADARANAVQGPPLQVVPVATVARVARYMQEIVLPHLLRADAIMFATNQTGHAQWIAGFVLANRSTRVTTRDITRAYGALRPPEMSRDLMSVMNSLVDVGWLEPETSPNPAKPTHAWIVNPRVHVVFAARAEKELAARQETRESTAQALKTILKKRHVKEERV